MTHLMHWLNIQHTGKPQLDPEVECGKEHEGAHWALHRAQEVVFTFALQTDGTSVPLLLSCGGKRYKLVEE